MKKSASIFFALVILLSSGMAQFALHICPQRGALLSEAACHMHESANSCCNPVKQVSPKKDDCCTTEFVFAMTPKFGGVFFENLIIPDFIHISGQSKQHCKPISTVYSNRVIQNNGPPKIFNRTLLHNLGLLII